MTLDLLNLYLNRIATLQAFAAIACAMIALEAWSRACRQLCEV